MLLLPAACIFAAPLSGCDNALESVQFGTWQAAAPGAPVANPDGEIQIATTTQESGTGATIERGDLVQLRYARTMTWTDGTEHADRSGDVWL